MYIIFPILLTVILTYLISASRQKKNAEHLLSLPGNYRLLLQQHVAFYRALNDEQKKKFEERITTFLSTISIEGINTEVEDLDKVLVAASAVIPIFGFTHWQYSNLTNVLLYPEHFNEAFELTGEERRVMGMVGTGAMNHKMILSRPALREGFMNETDRNNTAIHEFVHLLDKMDGDTDGIPEVLLEKQYTIPWINLMHEEIARIMQNKSDINPYGATSKTEFFAVASEYFFERPQLLKERHAALFDLMKEIFDQTPAVQAQAKENKIGRNDLCPCGSGEKYKYCHGDT